MKNPQSGAKPAFAPAPAQVKNPVEPKFPSSGKMPETPEDLFRALALTVSVSVSQPHPTGRKTASHEYAAPWTGFKSWHDARARLAHFETRFQGGAAWVPFNQSHSNDGPMSLNAYPGRAFIERVTNAGDAVIESRAATAIPPMPASPSDAALQWFSLGKKALTGGLSDDKLRQVAKSTIAVTAFVGDAKTDHKDSVLDVRDYGIGLSSDEMPDTILSLNRGNKKGKPWLTGKHGQGASSTFQYSDLTLIASRKIGSTKAAFTLIEAQWDDIGGVAAKTPTYKYLVVDGQVPEITVPASDFGDGTLVRHIGYNVGDLFNPFGQRSLYGLLMRSIAEPNFPVWLEMYTLKASSALGYPTFPGYRRYGRLIRGTVNVLEMAWAASLQAGSAPNTEGDDSEDISETEETAASDDVGSRILHRASEFYELPSWDFGARTGVRELGRVRINYWVAEPAGRTSQDVLRNWVDPDKTIVLTLDGQTHAEESRAIVTGKLGANLWAVGRYMVVQIDCNSLDQRTKYELFTSTREHAKETPIKKLILDELVRRLKFDSKLEELNVKMAAADVKQDSNTEDAVASLIKKYLKAAGVSFEQLTRKVEKWVDVEEEREERATKPEPPPIAPQEPPTFIRWKFGGTTLKLYPGQRHSAVFETDAPPSYWTPGDQISSRIKVVANGVHYVGAGEIRGGRVRCHFDCPVTLSVGSKGCFIQVQLEHAPGSLFHATLPVEVVEKRLPKKKPAQDPQTDDLVLDDDGKQSKIIKVKVRKKDFTEVDIPVVRPVPVKRSDTTWNTLNWPADHGRVGFSIRSLSGKIHLYYNAEFPPFLDLRHRMTKKSLADEFVRRYEIKLVLHTIFSLNYEFVDEDDFSEDQRKQVRHLLCATAESLALATKSELEIESKLKGDDSTPLETSLADVQDTGPGTAEA
jgi:hypothetical protein